MIACNCRDSVHTPSEGRLSLCETKANDCNRIYRSFLFDILLLVKQSYSLYM